MIQSVRQLEFGGEINGKEIIRNDLRRIVAVVSYHINRTSRTLEKMVFGGRNSFKNATLKIYRISHIGSTAIPIIWAKPIIDILVEIPRESNLFDYKDLIINKFQFVESFTAAPQSGCCGCLL